MRKSVLLAGLLVSIFLMQAVFVLSASDNSTLGSAELQAAASNVVCRTAMINSVISSISPLAGGSSLSDYSAKLSSDLSQLQSYASSGDKDSFKSYLSGSYDSDYIAAKGAIQDWRKTPGKNVSAADRKNLMNAYSSALQTFQSCHKDSLKIYGDGRVTSFTSQLDSYQKKADDLKAKGVDTSALNKIIQDARAQIVTPLQTALSAATDGNQIETALKGYCLFDGCKDGANFHLAAKFAIGELNIAVARVSNATWAGNFTSQIAQVNSDISAANSALISVGTNKYLPDQEKTVWDSIKAARDALKQIRPSKSGGSS